MTTTPNGYPIWTHTSDYSTYGGDANKANFQSQGAVNPRTDVTAEQFMRLVEDVAECARTAPFCLISITCNDTSPAAPTINWVRLATGIRATAYEGDAPPSGFPSAARVGNGAVSITFSGSYTDAFGVAGTWEPEHVITSSGDLNCRSVTFELSGSVVTLRGFASGGAAQADTTYTAEIS